MKPNMLFHFLLHSLVALLSATVDHGASSGGAGTSSIFTSSQLVYVTERDGGLPNLYYDVIFSDSETPVAPNARRRGYLVYVSTHDNTGEPRTSWAAVYSTELRTGMTQRLTPYGVADFGPAVSPSGTWMAVASYGAKGWDGETEDLRDDQWWSIYKAILPSNGRIFSVDSVLIERVTPPGLHAFTPATSPGNKKFIVVATRRPSSGFRHTELFDLVKNEFKELTRLVSPQTHHLNPFISPDSTRVGVDGAYPSFSPGNALIAYVEFPGIYVTNLDGSNRRKVYNGNAFSTAWDPARKGVIYTSAGPSFAPASSDVDIISINIEDPDQVIVKRLTTNGKNNAFPSPSPDGKRVVFRSGQTGYKNL
ncbi:Tricorn protease [Trema orientale]|uniref:Tricorn protease n=1 Tax=Trema orientale TaxID=63057 RepID=A0A2P5BNK3_TREOI|nr:Tricorn protease [Trema orientale]